MWQITKMAAIVCSVYSRDYSSSHTLTLDLQISSPLLKRGAILAILKAISHREQVVKPCPDNWGNSLQYTTHLTLICSGIKETVSLDNSSFRAQK
jgi:hypothetical protein